MEFIVKDANNEIDTLSKSEIFARKCSVSSKGINCGLMTTDEIYFSDKMNHRVLQYINKNFKLSYQKLQDAITNGLCYFSDWDWYDEWENGNEQFFKKDGTGIEIIKIV